MRTVFAACGLSMALACAPVETGIVAELGATFSLPLGETVVLRGTGAKIKFVRVREDSRCPTDVVCVWAGDAKIELLLSREGSPNESRIMSLSTPDNETSWGNLRVRFVGLAPVPRQSDGDAPRAYVAALAVSQL